MASNPHPGHPVTRRNVSTVRLPRWDRLPPEAHTNPLVPVIIVARGEPARTEDDYRAALPEQVAAYLERYTDVDPATVDLDALADRLVAEVLSPGGGLQVHRALLLHYVAQHRTGGAQ